MGKTLNILFLFLVTYVLAQPVFEIQTGDNLRYWALNGLVVDPSTQNVLCPGTDPCWNPPLRIPVEKSSYKRDAAPIHWVFTLTTDYDVPKFAAVEVDTTDSHPAIFRSRLWVGGCLQNGTCLEEKVRTSADWVCYTRANQVPLPQTKGSVTYQWYDPQYDDSIRTGIWNYPQAQPDINCSATSPLWHNGKAPWCVPGLPTFDPEPPASWIYMAYNNSWLNHLYCRYIDHNSPPSWPYDMNYEFHYDEDTAYVTINFQEPRIYFGRSPIIAYDLVYKRGFGSVSCTDSEYRCMVEDPTGPLCGTMNRNPADVITNPDREYTYTVYPEEGYAYYMFIRASSHEATSKYGTGDFWYIPPWSRPRCFGYPNMIEGMTNVTNYCEYGMKNNTFCTIPCNAVGYEGEIKATCHAFWSAVEPVSMAGEWYFTIEPAACPLAHCDPVPDNMLVADADLDGGLNSPCKADRVESGTSCSMTCYGDHAPVSVTPRVYCDMGVWKNEGECKPQCDEDLSWPHANFPDTCPQENVDVDDYCVGHCDEGYETLVNGVSGNTVKATCKNTHHYTYDLTCHPKPCRVEPNLVVISHGVWDCVETASGADCTNGWCETDYEEHVALTAHCELGRWTAEEGQCIKMCVTPPALAHSTFPVDCPPKNKGGFCDATCLDGFEGTPRADCGAEVDGVWKYTPDCTPKPCDSSLLAADTTQGQLAVLCTGMIPNGGKCEVSCDENHYPSPKVEYTCDHGDWEGPTGVCEPQCINQPATPANAHAYDCTLPAHVGDPACTTACNTPQWIGTVTAECKDFGVNGHHWEQTGECQPAPCDGALPIILNGGFPESCKTTVSGDDCDGFCNAPGFIGTPAADCYLHDWTVRGQEPHCLPVCYNAPEEHKDHATFTDCTLPTIAIGFGGQSNHVCEGECDFGYEGTAVATCQENHGWTYDISCSEKPCFAPIPDAVGTYVNVQFPASCSPKASGQSCETLCPAKYEGLASIPCSLGSWGQPTQNCFPQCVDAPTFSNGQVNYQPAQLPADMNTVFTVTCNPGYCPSSEVDPADPNPRVTCDVNHNWVPADFCTECSCSAEKGGELPYALPLEDASMMLWEGLVDWTIQGTSHGSIVTGICDTDYTGSYTAKCDKGEWKIVSGNCAPQCDDLYPADDVMVGKNGAVDAACGPDKNVDTLCPGSCNAGFGGNFHAVCRAIPFGAHYWDPVDNCLPLPCPEADLPDITGGIWDDCDASDNTYCTGHCMTSWVGGLNIYCDHGTWTNLAGGCTPQCQNDPIIANGVFNPACPDGAHLDECPATCDHAGSFLPKNDLTYDLTGAVCLAPVDEAVVPLWTTVGECVYSPCKRSVLDSDPQYGVANGQWECEDLPWGEVCHAKCNDNYKGEVTVECQEPGNWGEKIGQCEIIDPCKPNAWNVPNVPPIYRDAAGSVNATGPLITPMLCKNPILMPPDEATINYDHVEFTVMWRRWLDIKNITGTNRHDFALFEGVPVHTNTYLVRTSHDDTWFYANVKVALKVLWKLGCEIVGDPIIRCQFWAHAIEQFKLGPTKFNQSIAVRWPVDIEVPGRIGEISVKFTAWPTPLYDARITYFVMQSATTYAADMIFLVMVPAPYMSTNMRITALPDFVDYVPTTQDVCDFYGTDDKCFQQIQIFIKPTLGRNIPLPCSPGGLRCYNGTYTIQGDTTCIPEADLVVVGLDPSRWSGCSAPPGDFGKWVFSFAVTTADFCEYELQYDPTKNIEGVLRSYDAADFATMQTIFNADEKIYFRAYTQWIATPTFSIVGVDILKITVTPQINPAPFTEYDITTDELVDTNVGGSTAVSKTFSVLMKSTAGKPWTDPLLIPGWRWVYTFSVTLEVTYDFLGQKAKMLTTKTFNAIPFQDSFVGVPSTSAAIAAPAGSSVGIAVGATLGVVAIAAAVGAVWYFRTHRRGYTSEKL